MVRLTRYVIMMLCVVAACFAIGIFLSPVDNSDIRVKCRKEIAQIRDCLKNDSKFISLDFITWRLCNCVKDEIPISDQMSIYCFMVCKHMDAPIFSFQTNEGIPHLIDPWGQEYNIATTNEIDEVKRIRNIENWTIGPFIVWSSGPNRRNEYGGGDDILGARK